MGFLARSPLGPRVLEFFGHMRPDPRLAHRVAGLDFQSRSVIGLGLDPKGCALDALRRFGVSAVEVGPVGAATNADSRMLGRSPTGWRLAGAGFDPTIHDAIGQDSDLSLAQVWLRVESGVSAQLLDGILQDPGWTFSGITLAGWEAIGGPERDGLSRLFQERRLPWLLSLEPHPPSGLDLASIHDAVSRGALGVWFRSDSRRPDGSLGVESAVPSDLAPTLVRLRSEFGKDFVLVAGGVGSVRDALALRDSGADLVGLEVGMVFSGPGLPKRVNEGMLPDKTRSPISGRTSTEHPGSMAWTWGMILGVAMTLGGILAFGIAGTRVVLPYDEAFCGLDREQLKALNPRLLPFLSHDRISLAGTMLSAGILYAGLAWHGIRQGLHWAKVALVVSALSGFFSFFLFLGFGYFDPFHAFVTAVLFQFLLLVIHCPIAEAADPGPPELEEDRRWLAGLWGQLLMVMLGIGLVVAGVVICVVGAGPVLVREDLEFLSTTLEALQGTGRRLMPLIAHDRASLGGMLIACGLGVWLSAQWGFRKGRRWLWWTLALSGTPAFVAAIGIHLVVGYTDPLHLAPAIAGTVWFGVALGLSRGWLCLAPATPGTAFPASPK
jgi:dihydroorotate dehydrogenase